MRPILEGVRIRFTKGTGRPRHSSHAAIAKLIGDSTWLPIAAAAVLAAPLALLAISIHCLATGRVDAD